MLRRLAYSSSTDSFYKYFRMGVCTVSQTWRHFTKAIISALGPIHLRHLTSSDTECIFAQSERRGLPGIIGSNYCCKIWKSCSSAWQGLHKGKKGVGADILEAIADCSFWICDAIFGMPDCNNGINGLEASHVAEWYRKRKLSNSHRVWYNETETEHSILAGRWYLLRMAGIRPHSCRTIDIKGKVYDSERKVRTEGCREGRRCLAVKMEYYCSSWAVWEQRISAWRYAVLSFSTRRPEIKQWTICGKLKETFKKEAGNKMDSATRARLERAGLGGKDVVIGGVGLQVTTRVSRRTDM